MTNEEMLEKLKQIEEQARSALEEVPVRLARDRLKLIIGLAQYMKTDLHMSARQDRQFAEATEPSDPRQH